MGAPGKRTMAAAQLEDILTTGLGCWNSATRLLEKPTLSDEDFEKECNLGVPMKLSKMSLDMPLWSLPGETTLLQGGGVGETDPWALSVGRHVC